MNFSNMCLKLPDFFATSLAFMLDILMNTFVVAIGVTLLLKTFFTFLAVIHSRINIPHYSIHFHCTFRLKSVKFRT